VVVVGAGGAGLRAVVGDGSQAGLKSPVSPRSFPTRSHTVAAQGGISAALGNMGQDDWRWHMYDTVKGSDWLGDQDAIEYLCRERPGGLRAGTLGRALLAHRRGQDLSAPVRRHDHRIRRRPSRPAHLRRRRPHRPRDAAHALWPGAAHSSEFFIEYFALDLIMDEGACRGVVAMAWKTARSTVSAPTRRCSPPAAMAAPISQLHLAHTCTGDGNAMVLRAGLPLQDMEFVQFHPTGIYGAGCLITEGRAAKAAT
jgi:succinate dehydrogenase / fumarate reductase flavoprotein subunit